MRLFATVFLCLLIVGGTWAYVEYDKGIKQAASEILYAKADGITTVEIKRTFDCFDNSDFGEPALAVSFGKEEVFVDRSKTIPASNPVEIRLENVEVDQNSFTVYANSENPDEFLAEGPPLKAMLVTVKYDDRVVAEKIFHADAVTPSVGGDISFEIPAPETHDDHVH